MAAVEGGDSKGTSPRTISVAVKKLKPEIVSQPEDLQSFIAEVSGCVGSMKKA